MIKVLIVDDHALVRMGIRRLLEDTHDISVMGEAQNGEEALAMVKSHRPDVILLDMKMPGIDGWEVIRRLKNSSAKVFLLSAMSMSNMYLIFKVN